MSAVTWQERNEVGREKCLCLVSKSDLQFFFFTCCSTRASRSLIPTFSRGSPSTKNKQEQTIKPFLDKSWKYLFDDNKLNLLIVTAICLSSASQPWELQWVINTNKIIGKGYASRDFIQTWATKKIRRLTSIFNPVVKNFVNPTEIKENTTVNWESTRCWVHDDISISSPGSTLSNLGTRRKSFSKIFCGRRKVWPRLDKGPSHPQQLQENVTLLAKKHKFQNSTEDAFWKQRLWGKVCLKFDSQKKKFCTLCSLYISPVFPSYQWRDMIYFAIVLITLPLDDKSSIFPSHLQTAYNHFIPG